MIFNYSYLYYFKIYLYSPHILIKLPIYFWWLNFIILVRMERKHLIMVLIYCQIHLGLNLLFYYFKLNIFSLINLISLNFFLKEMHYDWEEQYFYLFIEILNSFSQKLYQMKYNYIYLVFIRNDWIWNYAFDFFIL